MAKNQLVIVESPAKAKTIESYLGDGYKVISSYGHIRQLLSKPNSVQISEDIKFIWQSDDKKISNILKYIKSANKILLATDMDREGEAIAWHISEILKENNYKGELKRISFVEITKNAIHESLKNQRDINQELVQAYFTRNGLDYLIGFNVSPELWKRFSALKNQSAGRVQTPALKIIIEREFERINFIQQKYYNLRGSFEYEKTFFEAELHSYEGKKLSDKLLDRSFLENIIIDIPKDFIIEDVTSKKITIKPQPPFITSTLQQEANKKIGIKVADVMKIAQNLYEGVTIDNHNIALITYMRTDSTNISADAQDTIRNYIADHFHNKLPKTPNKYNKKVKNAQEAHECIRPVDVSITPESIKAKLNDLQYKLYTLIWNRAVASQMISAIREQTSFHVIDHDKKYLFKTSCSCIVEEGFMCLIDRSDDDKMFRLEKGKPTKLMKHNIIEHETQPPGRFSEASLVNELEKYGIGRPSTYATIIEVLLKREYVTKKDKFLIPTLKGEIIACFLSKFFPKYSGYEFTAHIEEILDKIANGQENYIQTLKDFFEELQQVIKSTKDFSTLEIMNQVGQILLTGLNKKCECGNDLQLRMKFSVMFICSVCNKMEKIDQESESIAQDIQIVSTTNYKYILSNGIKVYLPQKFTETLNEEQAKKILLLPRTIEIDQSSSLLIGMSKYGFYIKYNDKFFPLTFKQLCNSTDKQIIDILHSYLKRRPSTKDKVNNSTKDKFKNNSKVKKID